MSRIGQKLGLKTAQFLDLATQQGFLILNIVIGEDRKGSLPRKVAFIAKEWCLVHQAELQDRWQRA